MNSKEKEIVNQAINILDKEIKLTNSVTSPKKVIQYLRLKTELNYREHFTVIFLNNKNCVIETKILFSGSINSSEVHPRIIAKECLLNNTMALIVSHNHPTGYSKPSESDISLTKRLQEVLSLIDVNVLDHIIIGKGEYFSFQENGLI